MMEIDPSNEEAFPGITAVKVELQVMYKSNIPVLFWSVTGYSGVIIVVLE